MRGSGEEVLRAQQHLAVAGTRSGGTGRRARSCGVGGDIALARGKQRGVDQWEPGIASDEALSEGSAREPMGECQ